MAAFLKIFSMTNIALKARRVGENHGLDLDLRVVNLVITGARLSSKVERVVL